MSTEQETKKRVWLIVGIAALVVMFILGQVIGRLTAPRTAETAPPAETSAPAPAPTSAPPSASASGTESAPGTDATGLHSPDGTLETTIRTFVEGWQETDPVKRKELLQKSATPELTQQLMLTDPGNVETSELVEIKYMVQSAHSGEAKLQFASELQIVVTATYDPVAPKGGNEWQVFKVEEW